MIKTTGSQANQPSRSDRPSRAAVAVARVDCRLALLRLAIVAAIALAILTVLAALAASVKAAPVLPVAPVVQVAPAARPLLIDGETLDFDIYYGAMPAGHASLAVESDETADGAIYRITSADRSNDLVSLFFTVDDEVISEIDAETYEPRQFEKKIREGSLRKHVTVSYRENGLVRAGDETFRVEPGTRDILSALYYVRGQDLRVGDEVIVRTFENGKNYQARVRVQGREKVSTRRGTYECLVVEPEIAEGIFAKTGRMLIYLTDDALKIPVLLKSKVKVGSFVAELVGRSHSGGER
jgi:hypothetical protein